MTLMYDLLVPSHKQVKATKNQGGQGKVGLRTSQSFFLSSSPNRPCAFSSSLFSFTEVEGGWPYVMSLKLAPSELQGLSEKKRCEKLCVGCVGK